MDPMKNWTATPDTGSSKILLIDDNRCGLLVRKTVLEEMGHSIVSSASPFEGLEHFASTPFDLVITDYRMPGMNGSQVIAAIRESRPEMPIILISGLVDALGLNEQNTGADSVISKNNMEVANLTRSVSRLLKRKPVKKPVGSQTGLDKKASGL